MRAISPAGPVITAPLDGDVVDSNNLVVRWEPVTQSTALNPPRQAVNIVGYQVNVVEQALLLRAVDKTKQIGVSRNSAARLSTHRTQDCTLRRV